MTSKGTIVTLTPLLKTMLADSGSTKMLNSADGVMLPIPIAPPIMTMLYILVRISGKALIKIARLVMAPVTTNLTLLSFEEITL